MAPHMQFVCMSIWLSGKHGQHGHGQHANFNPNYYFT